MDDYVSYLICYWQYKKVENNNYRSTRHPEATFAQFWSLFDEHPENNNYIFKIPSDRWLQNRLSGEASCMWYMWSTQEYMVWEVKVWYVSGEYIYIYIYNI